MNINHSTSKRNLSTRKKGPGRIAARGAHNSDGKKVIVSYRAFRNDIRNIFRGSKQS
jgi:hypothetical protein